MDTIGDLITRIRNGYLAAKDEIEAPYSRLSEAVCRLLAAHGYLAEVDTPPGKTRMGKTIKLLKVKLLYRDGQPVLTAIKRVSKPGRRIYEPVKRVKKQLGGYGLAIVSTSQGLMSDDQARQKGIGGEILFVVW